MTPPHFSSFPWKDLINWYKQYGRKGLPWRKYNQETNILLYHVWISEIFLQQTQVSRVMEYFNRVTERFPTLYDLSITNYETFFPYYQGLGYYSRARNMLKTSQIVWNEYGGIFPSDKLLLKKLPGVGPYTANAILAFGYGEPHLAWDTNLEKVFSRYIFGDRHTLLGKAEKEQIERDFLSFILSSEDTLIQKERVRDINNALMDFSAIIENQKIDWDTYPIRSGVFYETRGEKEEIKKRVSSFFPIPDASIIVFLHKDHKIYYGNPQGKDHMQSFQDGIFPSFLYKQENALYVPFILPPALHRNTREYVQDFFRNTYGLEVSVRPIHKKWIEANGSPYVAVRAQIQIGHTQQFPLFKK